MEAFGATALTHRSKKEWERHKFAELGAKVHLAMIGLFALKYEFTHRINVQDVFFRRRITCKTSYAVDIQICS